MTHRSSGFTIVEIGVIVPIIMVLAIVLFSVMFNYLLASNRDQVQLAQAYTQASALDRLEWDIRLSSAFLTTTDDSVTDPYGANQSGSAWNFSGSDATHRVLMLREYATANNPLSTVRSPVYQMTSTAPNCSLPIYISGPLTYNIIYFVKDKTLYKRIVVNSSARTCQTQYQKLSCPSTTTLGVDARNAACGADDEVIAQNVSGFSVDYYANQSSTTPLNTYASPSLAGSARSINVTIENSQSSYNGSVTTHSSLRTASQNNSVGGGS